MIQEVVADILGELLTAHLERKAAYAAKPGELRYGLAMKISGLLFFLVSAGFTALLVTGNYRVGNPVETVSLVVLIASFGMGAVYLTGRSFFANGRYDGESICFKSPFSRTKTEKWKDLKVDITSIPSYATANAYVRYGYNRDGEDYDRFTRKLLKLKKTIEEKGADALSPADARFFIITQTPKRGLKVEFNDAEIQTYRKRF
ncbi:hypothetical protein LJC22_05050 [Desulfosarcina sp. OttesenSCG-928-G10]|nr:hypothetical protein [Desulfosarcina sp. OttesenSCG-928-G10]